MPSSKIQGRFSNLNDQISFYTVCALSLLYIFSHPYPQSISIIELGVGLLLGIAFLTNLFFIQKSPLSFVLIGLLSICLIWPLFVGVIEGSSLGQISRDLIPFLYLCFASLFLIRKSDAKNNFFQVLHKNLPWILAVTGVVFALREILPFSEQIIAKKGIVWLEMHLLIQSSAVTFSMCFLLLRGCNYIYDRKNIKGIFLVLLSTIPFIGTYLAVMRAPTAFYILCLLLICFIWPVSVVKKTLISSLVIFIFIVSAGPSQIAPYLENLTNKQKNHGNNGKVEEIVAITERTLDAPNYVQFLGQGWGSSWASPAVQASTKPGKRISYAHSFIAYSILKFGLSGYIISLLLVSLVTYLFFFTWSKVKSFSYDGTVLFSTMPALLIGIFLEPNYKTLDFSLILIILIILYTTVRNRTLEDPATKPN